MESINIRQALDGTIIPVEEIDLSQVTVKNLIDELVASGQLSAPALHHEYRLTGKNNEIITDNVTLKEAGIQNGDTVTLLDKAIGASYYDSENDPAGNDPGTGESSGEE